MKTEATLDTYNFIDTWLYVIPPTPEETPDYDMLCNFASALLRYTGWDEGEFER